MSFSYGESIIKCVFCNGYLGPNIQVVDTWFYLIFRCICTEGNGSYLIERSLFDDISDEPHSISNRHEMSGYIREMTEERMDVRLTTENFSSVINSNLIPSNLSDKVNKLVSYIYKKTRFIGEFIKVQNQFYCITYSFNESEFVAILDYLKNKNLINQLESDTYGLTFEGIELAESIQQTIKKTNQCFIAMSFNEGLLTQFKEIVMPKIKETGFRPITVDMVHHNDDIADRIIYEIKNSHFVIADFTQQKKGVYYEAGFAKGLGLEVIWTVHKDDIENCHFDTNHQNHIVWETPIQLAELLQNRILATIAGASLKSGL